MAKAIPIVLGAVAVGALLLLAGSGTAKAAPKPKTPDVPAPPVPPPPGPVTFQTMHLRDLSIWIGDRIQESQWRAFSPADNPNPQTPEQREAVEALVTFQSRVGLEPDAQLGPRTAGALIWFDPELETTLRLMGVVMTPSLVAEGRALAQAADAAENPST